MTLVVRALDGKTYNFSWLTCMPAAVVVLVSDSWRILRLCCAVGSQLRIHEESS